MNIGFVEVRDRRKRIALGAVDKTRIVLGEIPVKVVALSLVLDIGALMYPSK
jgi:hypothetical protein